MPTRTRTPDHVAVAGIDLPLVQAGVTGTELRQVPVPNGWPPYDCETHGVGCQATAPTASTTATTATATDQEASHRPAPPSAAGPDTAQPVAGAEAGAGARGADAGAGTRGTVAGGAPATAPGEARPGGHDRVAGPSAAWCGQFAQVLVEVLAGYRPAKQLARATTERVREHVDLLSCAVTGGERPRIRRVMTSRPAAGVVEMTMVASFGSRSRALAIRFEHVPARPPTPGRPARPARWLCTEIETPLAAGPVVVIAARRLRASSFGTFGHSPAATYGARPPPGLRFMIMAEAAC
jgi:Family of unknown function (DUF6459)